jgi:hypothetical protein
MNFCNVEEDLFDSFWRGAWNWEFDWASFSTFGTLGGSNPVHTNISDADTMLKWIFLNLSPSRIENFAHETILFCRNL